MNIFLSPLVADIYAYGEAMNRLYFIGACGLAVVAILLAFLPRLHRVTRWMSIGFALACISTVVFVSTPNNLPAQPVWVMALPVLVALVSIGLSLRTLIRK
jgi:hypothetical protein